MSLGSQLPTRLASSCSESLPALFVMKLKSGATGGHMLPVGPLANEMHKAGHGRMDLFSYCEFWFLVYVV